MGTIHRLCPRLSSQAIQPFHVYRQAPFPVHSVTDAEGSEVSNKSSLIQIGDFGFAQNRARAFRFARDPALGPGPPGPGPPMMAPEFRRREDRWDSRTDGKWLYSLPVRQAASMSPGLNADPETDL